MAISSSDISACEAPKRAELPAAVGGCRGRRKALGSFAWQAALRCSSMGFSKARGRRSLKGGL